MPSLLFIADKMRPPGGGAGVSAWALQALAEDWDVTLLVWHPPEFAALDRHFGTSLAGRQIHVVRPPRWLYEILKRDPDPSSYQGMSYLMRVCRRIGHRFDALFCPDNEFDFGRPGIQYVHYPYLAKHIDVIQRVRTATPLARAWQTLRGINRPWLMMSGVTVPGIESNLTLVNSDWTGALFEELYCDRWRVIYPPAVFFGEPLPWANRSQTAVCLGRIEPAKRQVEAIDIIERVRARGHDLQLRVIGDIASPDYGEEVRQRAERAGEWVRLEHGISRSELDRALGSSRFGLHAMIDEHFGMAGAEMLRAGCVVFAPDSGGQVEVLGHESRLLYSDDDRAVDAICAVLDDAGTQEELHRFCSAQGQKFSEQRFTEELRAVVRENHAPEHQGRESAS